MSELRLTFSQGKVRAIYDDELAEVFRALGEAKTERVSDVEPDGAGWTAYVRHGTIAAVPAWAFGPYATRAEALAAERAYLEEKAL